ncbi:MAG: transposase [Phycisphaeraceae bacterium]|nr:transposase [Phycisphaeraceae bacterium]
MTVQPTYRKPMRRRDIPGGVRFITFSCRRRLPLLRSAVICRVVLEAMARARTRFSLEIFAWVLMPEHVHLLLRPPEGGVLAPALKSLKLSVSMRVIARWREIEAPILSRILDADGCPRYWQKGGGFDRNVRDEHEFLREVRYIHRNPVERGLVERPEDWEWSSVRWWMGLRDGEFPCDPPPGDPRVWAAWKGFK